MYSWRGAQGRQRSKDSELQEGIPEGITEGVTFNACPRGDWENGRGGQGNPGRWGSPAEVRGVSRHTDVCAHTFERVGWSKLRRCWWAEGSRASEATSWLSEAP